MSHLKLQRIERFHGAFRSGSLVKSLQGLHTGKVGYLGDLVTHVRFDSRQHEHFGRQVLGERRGRHKCNGEDHKTPEGHPGTDRQDRVRAVCPTQVYTARRSSTRVGDWAGGGAGRKVEAAYVCDRRTRRAADLYGLPEAICGNREADHGNSAPMARNRRDLPALLSKEARTVRAAQACGHRSAAEWEAPGTVTFAWKPSARPWKPS